MNYKKLIVESGMRMFKSGLTVGTWGNISARNPENELIYLTPSGMPYDIITEDDIVVMNSKMEVVEGKRKPTIEFGMHIGILNARPELNAVVHTHPIYSQIFACLNEDIPPINDEAAQAMAGPVRCAEYALPGTEELARNVVKALGDGYACLLANHGALCAGPDMDNAFHVCTVLEMISQIYYMARCIGKPTIIPDDKVKFMRDFVLNSYGQPRSE
ncbi:MAG: class II aldolase/adducin family protein [Oscillospiraceae bacterium]|nr:class II aldolase/adducin family protein [Oscillospiraceae bacterium]